MGADMKKQELLAALGSKFHRVETPALEADYGELRYYLVKVYHLVDDGLRDVNIPFYVEKEGLPEEAAYWSPSEPLPTRPTEFREEVQAYIAQKISDGTIEGAYIEQIDQANETAVGTAIMSDLTEKRLFLDKDGNGDLRHRALV
jgi:hypothetical protein